MKSKKAAKSVEQPAELSAESAAPKPMAKKKAAAKTVAEKVPAKKAPAEKAAVKKTAAKKTAVKAKGRGLVDEVPAIAEVADVLHETEDEALAGFESHASGADGFRQPADDAPADDDPEFVAPESDEDEESESDEDEDADEDDEEEAEDEDGDDDDEEVAGGDEDPKPAYEAKPGNPERLQKVLAKAGVASRRAAEEMILAGRVQLNGKIVTELGTKAELGRDHIRVDGKLIRDAQRLRYFVLNKPKGYVTTVSDPEKRPTVMEFFAGERERLYPVGRLDYLSEGLLLVTNDGELANSLTKAANGVEKTYLVKVAGTPNEEQLDQLRQGMVIERGRLGSGSGRVRTAPAEVRKVRDGDNPWYEVILIEGRNREIRKLFEEIGHHVEKIRRVGYGPLVLDLEPGKVRELDEDEIHKLRLTAEGKLKTRRRRGPAPAQLERKAGRAVQHEKWGEDRGYGKTPPPRRLPVKLAAQAEDERPVQLARPARQSPPDRPGRPAQFDRAPRSDRPARFTDRPSPRTSAPRETGSSAGTGRRPFQPLKTNRPVGERPEGRKPDFGDRKPGFSPRKPDFTPRPPREDAPADRPARRERPAESESRESRFEKKPFKPAGEFKTSRPDRAARPADRGPARGFDRDRPARPDRGGFAGQGRGDRKPFRTREEVQEAAEFGTEPIERTPGFRVEEVKEAPRAPRPPRPGGFGGRDSSSARGPARFGNKPFRAEGDRPASDRPTGSRPPARPGGRPSGNRPPRPISDRGERPASAAGRSSGGGTAGRVKHDDFRPRRTFTEGEDRPRSPRPGVGRPSGPGRPKPFSASGPARPGTGPKREEGDAPRDKKRWRNSFEGKNKGRPKPKPKKDA